MEAPWSLARLQAAAWFSLFGPPVHFCHCYSLTSLSFSVAVQYTRQAALRAECAGEKRRLECLFRSVAVKGLRLHIATGYWHSLSMRIL